MRKDPSDKGVCRVAHMSGFDALPRSPSVVYSEEVSSAEGLHAHARAHTHTYANTHRDRERQRDTDRQRDRQTQKDLRLVLSNRNHGVLTHLTLEKTVAGERIRCLESAHICALL